MRRIWLLGGGVGRPLGDPSTRSAAPPDALVAAGLRELLSGMAANGAKMLLARTRPYAFDFHGNVWTTFGQWLPASGMGQSFPSGHAATAAGLALALAALYPNARRFFLLMAVLVACQRIECGAAFPSDVLCGAAIGCLTAACCLRFGAGAAAWCDERRRVALASRQCSAETLARRQCHPYHPGCPDKTPKCERDWPPRLTSTAGRRRCVPRRELVDRRAASPVRDRECPRGTAAPCPRPNATAAPSPPGPRSPAPPGPC